MAKQILNASSPLRPVALVTIGVVLLGTMIATPQRPANASCAVGPYDCITTLLDADSWWNSLDFTTTQQTYLTTTFYNNKFINDFFNNLMVTELWENNIRVALMEMTSQLVSARVDLTGVVGGFFDGAQTLDTQLVLQELHARAIKDYTPGENLCRIGTGVRSLASAEEKAMTAEIALTAIAEGRQMGTKGTGSAYGGVVDRQGRFNQFQRLYCDPGDNNGQMAELCGATPASDTTRFNKDIDYTRTLDSRPTLDFNFTDGQIEADEEDIMALSSNLYSHDVFSRLREYQLNDPLGQNDNEYRYLTLRQVAALRSVAQNSFNVIAGMRARGAAGSAQFLRNVLREMGMSEEEARRYLGGATAAGSTASTTGAANGEPSYYAQMEILTKKLYQSPNFYTSLIDKPANVMRVQAAMQGIGLMQDADIRKSFERQEMLISLLLELDVREAQEEVQRDLETLGTAQKGN